MLTFGLSCCFARCCYCRIYYLCVSLCLYYKCFLCCFFLIFIKKLIAYRAFVICCFTCCFTCCRYFCDKFTIGMNVTAGNGLNCCGAAAYRKIVNHFTCFIFGSDVRFFRSDRNCCFAVKTVNNFEIDNGNCACRSNFGFIIFCVYSNRNISVFIHHRYIYIFIGRKCAIYRIVNKRKRFCIIVYISFCKNISR